MHTGNTPSVLCVQIVFSCYLPPLQAQAASTVAVLSGAVAAPTWEKMLPAMSPSYPSSTSGTCLGSERKQLRCAGTVILFNNRVPLITEGTYNRQMTGLHVLNIMVAVTHCLLGL